MAIRSLSPLPRNAKSLPLQLEDLDSLQEVREYRRTVRQQQKQKQQKIAAQQKHQRYAA